MKTLFPEQAACLEILHRAVKAHGVCLNASETGTGKTLVTIELCRRLGVRPLVVCPKPVVTAWVRAAEEQGVEVEGVINYEKLKTGRTPLVKKENSKFVWSLPRGSVVVFDEVHVCRALTSQNAALLASARKQGLRLILLSATPFETPLHLKSLGFCLGLHNYTDFYPWALANGCRKNRWNGLEFDPRAKDKLTAIAGRIYPAYGARLTRQDLGAHFAQIRVDWTPLDFDTAAINSAYADVEGPMQRLAERASLDGDEPIELVKILRARQRVELIKAPTIVELAEEYLETGMSVFVAVNFDETIDHILTKFPDAAVIRGGQSVQKRQVAIDAFQENRTRICVANIKAGGVGISLHDTSGRHPRVALISPSFSATELRQALGRIDRVGAQSNGLQRILVAAGTVEERICTILHQKDDFLTCASAQDAPVSGNENEKMVSPVPSTAVQSGPADHARFSPSQLKHFNICPGYKPGSETNAAAEAGTRIHEALELDDDSRLQDEFERWMAEECRRAVHGIIRRHSFSQAKAYKEVRLDVTTPLASTYGTCDLLLVQGSAAVAIDYKTGKWPVDDAEKNYQAFAYTSGVFQKFPALQTVDFYFVVPQRNEVTHAKFTRQDLAGLEARIGVILAQAEEAHSYWDAGKAPPNRLLRQDRDNCRFCAMAEQCPKTRALAVGISTRYSPDLQIPDIVHGSENDSPEEIAAMMRMAPVLEAWVSGVRRKARYLAFEQGVDIPGYEVSSRKGMRKITDFRLALDTAKRYGVSVEDFLTSVGSVSVEKFEALVSATAPRGSKKARVEEVFSDLYANGGLAMSEDTMTLVEKRS